MRDEVEYAKELFARTPPDYHQIEALFKTAAFSAEELAAIAYAVTDDCLFEYNDLLDGSPGMTIDTMHSHYLLKSIRILLDNGLDPNMCCAEGNALYNMVLIDSPGLAASAMRCLLESGGDPNLICPGEEGLFDDVTFNISYDEYTHKYFNVFQCWLVLMAYGGCWSNGEIPLTMLGGHTVEEFKHFEKFDNTIEMLPQEPNKYGCWIMHIFDTETGEEVAVYK